MQEMYDMVAKLDKLEKILTNFTSLRRRFRLIKEGTSPCGTTITNNMAFIIMNFKALFREPIRIFKDIILQRRNIQIQRNGSS